MDAQPLGLEPKTYPIAERNTAIELGAPVWPFSPADFLRLRLKVSYSALWKLRKPERMQLEISAPTAVAQFKAFVLPPNVSTDVWFYPWSETDLRNYFDADEARWRQGDRPAITEIRILITPLDWISQTTGIGHAGVGRCGPLHLNHWAETTDRTLTALALRIITILPSGGSFSSEPERELDPFDEDMRSEFRFAGVALEKDDGELA